MTCDCTRQAHCGLSLSLRGACARWASSNAYSSGSFLLTRWHLTTANEPGFRTLAMFLTPKVRTVSMQPHAIDVTVVDLPARVSTVH